jgi:hypothetical protein
MRTIKRGVSFLGLAVCASLTLATPAAYGAETHSLKIGVAKLDITPKDLTGLVGISPRPYGGVHDLLYARALVLNNGVTTAAIVALDVVEIGNTLPLRQRIARELAIPADHILINASHDHSAPRAGPVTAGTSSADGRPYSTPAYIQQVDEAIVAVLKQAKSALQPARVGYGTGKVDVNVARYGYTLPRGWGEAPNEDGFADKTLAVVKFETPAGAPIAILFNYAVHSNSMSGEPGNQVNGDIAGNAEKFVEHQYGDKVVALWSMGAAADAYPKFNWNMGLLDDKSSPYQPVEMQGGMIGGEVLKVVKRITRVTDVATLYAAERIVACEMNVRPANATPAAPGGPPAPGGAGAAGGQNGPPNGAPQPPRMPLVRQMAPPNPGDKLNIYMGFIRINQLAITGVSGEVGSGIFQHLKRESPFLDNMMITLSNDRAGYIPDDAGWDHMGNGAAFVRGCAEAVIVSNLVDMMNASLQ